jgi:hypothetical protein
MHHWRARVTAWYNNAAYVRRRQPSWNGHSTTTQSNFRFSLADRHRRNGAAIALSLTAHLYLPLDRRRQFRSGEMGLALSRAHLSEMCVGSAKRNCFRSIAQSPITF